MIEVARHEALVGSPARAWETCNAAAAIARELRDPELLATAATLVIDPGLVAWRSVPARQALCLEALGLLGPAGSDDASTEALRERVVAHLDALSTGWAEHVDVPAESVTADEAVISFAALRADHGRATGPGGAAERLAIAAEMVALARAAADDGILAWARMWRLDALQQLGLRVEFNAALSEFGAVVERLDSPIWTWRHAMVLACVALLEDRLDDLPHLVAIAQEAGAASGADEAPFIELILRSAIAQRTGDGLVGIEARVREAIADAPFLAQGWRALLLVSIGRRDEALGIWRALAPHIGDVPTTSPEWLLSAVGHSELAILAGDRAHARQLLELMRPYAQLHLAGPAMTPYGGPIALPLARLAAFLGDRDAASEWAREAVERSEGMGAPWYAVLARQVLAGRADALGPLSPRESDVARLIAEGASNREIASTLYLSERTVEQHTRTILRKLDQPNRAAVAVWVVRAGAGGAKPIAPPR
ncbi:MAG: helix-turn-helix transcriptional regulator [Leifsonia flava]